MIAPSANTKPTINSVQSPEEHGSLSQFRTDGDESFGANSYVSIVIYEEQYHACGAITQAAGKIIIFSSTTTPLRPRLLSPRSNNNQ